MTQRVGVFFSIWREELNLSCFPMWLKELFFSKCSRNWTSLPYELLFDILELNSFFFDQYDSKSRISSQKMTQSVEPFRNMTHRIEFFWNEKDSQNWTLLFTHRSEPFFSTWLTVLNPSFQHVSKNFFFDWLKKNWTLCQKKSLKEWNFFLFWSKELFPFFFNLTRRIEPFFQHVSMNWTFFLNMTHRIEPFFQYVCKNSDLFKNYDSLNWTFLQKRLKECFEK